MIRPLSNSVILEPVTVEVSEGGIVFPQSWAVEEMEFRVVACGTKVSFDIQPGMRVICHNAGTQFEYQGRKLRVVDAKDVLMILGVAA